MGVSKLKCACPVCKSQIELDINQYDQGDFVKCDECNELLEVEIKNGNFRLVTDQEKKFEEMEELDEELDSDEDE
ncbi:MAG TPA: hypothetical protein VFF13_03090 [archaeon]|nr:hypothetical protein [archaeon]